MALPTYSAKKSSLTSFGALSVRASVVLRDARGRTASGRDIFLLHLTLKGDDISAFFKYVVKVVVITT